MTAAPIAPSRRSSHAWRRSIALISREAGKVYVTKRRFAAPSAQSVTAEVAAVAREAAANRG